MTHANPTRAQRGVTLIVALVMLVVIGFMSVAVMRGALTGDTVANNLRVQNFATQQAQLGLRYCESHVQGNKSKPVADQVSAGILAAPKDNDPKAEAEQNYAWKKFSNWLGPEPATLGSHALDVPKTWQSTAIDQLKPGRDPQCLIQRIHTGLPGTYVITARGFSPDWSEDDAGHTRSGSVVWLQSIVAM